MGYTRDLIRELLDKAYNSKVKSDKKPREIDQVPGHYKRKK